MKHAPLSCPAAVAAVSHSVRTAGRLCGMSPLSLAASSQSSPYHLACPIVGLVAVPHRVRRLRWLPRRTVVSHRQPRLGRSALPPLPIDARIPNAASGITNLPRFARAAFSGSPHSTTKLTPTAPSAPSSPPPIPITYNSHLDCTLSPTTLSAAPRRLEPTCAVYCSHVSIPDPCSPCASRQLSEARSHTRAARPRTRSSLEAACPHRIRFQELCDSDYTHLDLSSIYLPTSSFLVTCKYRTSCPITSSYVIVGPRVPFEDVTTESSIPYSALSLILCFAHRGITLISTREHRKSPPALDLWSLHGQSHAYFDAHPVHSLPAHEAQP
ncbi:hypothetical protein B0H13DRAFT_2542410 [Mycena leptocephala]|nr:hypothetical protein B0H13DRAFT_2542410 [Mycena leptocephala]